MNNRRSFFKKLLALPFALSAAPKIIAEVDAEPEMIFGDWGEPIIAQWGGEIELLDISLVSDSLYRIIDAWDIVHIKPKLFKDCQIAAR